jgi:hypothetical protein
VGARFSAPVQTGPEAHPASYTKVTRSFPGAKRPGRDVDHPPPSSAEVKERIQLYFNCPSGPSWPVIGCTFVPGKEILGVSLKFGYVDCLVLSSNFLLLLALLQLDLSRKFQKCGCVPVYDGRQ